MLKKITITCSLLICLMFSSVAFAGGRNIVDDLQFTVKEISIHHVDGDWITLFSGDKNMKKGETLDISKSIDEGVKEGQYDQIKYVFANDFKIKGRIIIDSGAYAGTYMSGVVAGNDRAFEKDYDAPNWVNLKYSAGTEDYGWAKVTVTASEYTTIESIGFSIDRETGKRFNVGFDTAYTWMGKINFDENSTNDVKAGQTPSGNDEWLGINGDIITVPFFDPPEIEQI